MLLQVWQVEDNFFFLFWQYWGLNLHFLGRCSTTWVTLPASAGREWKEVFWCKGIEVRKSHTHSAYSLCPPGMVGWASGPRTGEAEVGAHPRSSRDHPGLSEIPSQKQKPPTNQLSKNNSTCLWVGLTWRCKRVCINRFLIMSIPVNTHYVSGNGLCIM
jgi:hypothetical protein